MHVLKSTSLVAAVVSSLLMLSACGGGGAGKSASNNTAGTSTSATPQPAPPPVVLPTTTVSLVFDGRATDTNQPMTTLLQADGSYFQVYSDANSGAPTGVILGAGALANGSFNSAGAVDLSLVGTGGQTPLQANVTATYRDNQSFNGTVTYTNSAKAPVAFSSTFNNTYSTLPTLASLAGVYTGSIATNDVREDNIKLTVASDGTLTGQISCGCSITASLAPRADRTSYVATLAFTGGDHPLSNKSIGGNVYLDAAKKRLYIIGRLGGNGEQAIFVGTKP